jgi:4-carboxymuconolactone decarboxylase
MRLFAATFAALSCAASAPADATGSVPAPATLEVRRQGSEPPATGSPDTFIGTVRIDTRFQRSDPARVGGATVSFAPGARTA